MVIINTALMFYLYKVSLRTYFNLEEKNIISRLLFAQKVIFNEINDVDNTCKDYAFWDDTYEFIKTGEKEYLESNYIESTFKNNWLDFALIANNDGKVVYSGFFDRDSQKLMQLPSYLTDYFNKNTGILNVKNTDKAIKGLYVLPENIFMLSAEPILNSSVDKPATGTLVFGRLINEDVRQYLSEMTNMDLSFYKVTPGGNENLLQSEIKEISDGKGYYIDYKSSEIATAFLSLKTNNIYPGLLLKINFNRDIYQEGLSNTIIYSILANLLIIMTFVLLIYHLQRLILKRVVLLKNAVNKINLDGSYILEFEDNSKDEIGTLTANIKNMFEKMDQSRKKIVANEERYRELFENSIDGISIRSKDGKFFDVNNSLVKILGYDSKEEILKLDISREIYADESDFLKINSLKKGSDIVKMKKKDGKTIWAEVTPRIISDAKIGIYYENIVRNVTNGVEKEEEIKFLNFYDKLTGLYNRVYFGEKIKRIDNKKFFPLAVILVDINGLKLINDAFGYKAGNKVLREVAYGLKNSCMQEEIIARWGGDEFIIISGKTSEKDVAIMSKRIIKNCSKIFYKNTAINISLGSSIKNNEAEDLRDVITEAESRMLRHKLFELNSASSSAILSLERALWEKSNETEEHAARLKNLVVEIGRKINLPTNMLDDLILLASLHDIGKVAISNDILSKKTKLTKKEWEIFKKHPETGYQIAKSSPQLAHIAEYILFHHEWWDGSGYPKGIKGEEIPLISRLLSIADAYDVMIEGRVYKPPFTISHAIEEIKKFSGRQFDPELVNIFIKILKDKIENTDKEIQ
jgi:diguanylate cyclase (GGDEF)-like protein/PAS domain S-box-containing protein